MTPETACVAETKYLLGRALRSRGIVVREGETAFYCKADCASFRVSLMPGNRRILISHHSVVFKQYRGHGHGRRFLDLREQCAREAGINLLLATVRDDNKPEVRLLETSGWQRLIERETGVTLWGKRL